MTAEGKMATNMAIRSVIDSIREIIGDKALLIVFRSAGMEYLLDNLPPYDWEPCISTEDQVKIYWEVENLLGLNGAIGVWRRIGLVNMKHADEMGHVLDGFVDLDPIQKFQKALELFCIGTGKGRAMPNDEYGADLDVFDCLLCKNDTSNKPICSLYEGVMQYISDWAFGKGVYLPREVTCMARGDSTCYFILEKR
jgi:predicted hydrocarbon binding protein